MPWPSDGTFAPWANLYRVWIDITDFTSREITIEAGGLLNGAVQTQDIGSGFWPMQVAVPEGQVVGSNFSFETASFHFHFIPTPGAASALALGGLAAVRRRRR
ncbi:MAG: MYXO-CTERM sorting domain-containing protein [Phycisphaerales bacterium]